MQRDKERQSEIILSIIGIIPVVWLGLLIAPSVKGGLPEIFPSLMNVFNNPFHIVLCEDSVKTVLILLLCYGMGIGIYFSTQKNYSASGTGSFNISAVLMSATSLNIDISSGRL